MNKYSYVITMASGLIDDYEHGVIFSVPSAQAATQITDKLNQYASFRSRIKDEVIVWQGDYFAEYPVDKDNTPTYFKKLEEAEKSFVKSNFPLPEDLQQVEALLEKAGINYSFASWPEESIFAFQVIPHFEVS